MKLKKVKLLRKKLIKYRKNQSSRTRSYDDEIIFMKLNFIEKFKEKK